MLHRERQMTQSWNLTPAEDSWKPAGQAANAFSSPVADGREHLPRRIATWRGLPGRYDRPQGMPWSETFVVYDGTGVLRHDDETIDLKPGTIVNLRQGQAYVMEIFTTLEKMAVIWDGRD